MLTELHKEWLSLRAGAAMMIDAIYIYIHTTTVYFLVIQVVLRLSPKSSIL